MKVALVVNGTLIPSSFTEGALHIDAEGKCPLCNMEPWKVRGKVGTRVVMDSGRGREVCKAFCVNCRQVVGDLAIQWPTIFGLEEDAAVLEGRPRVYR